jgi:hypothetical protein
MMAAAAAACCRRRGCRCLPPPALAASGRGGGRYRAGGERAGGGCSLVSDVWCGGRAKVGTGGAGRSRAPADWEIRAMMSPAERAALLRSWVAGGAPSGGDGDARSLPARACPCAALVTPLAQAQGSGAGSAAAAVVHDVSEGCWEVGWCDAASSSAAVRSTKGAVEAGAAAANGPPAAYCRSQRSTSPCECTIKNLVVPCRT